MSAIFIIILVILVMFALPGISFAPWVPTRSKDIHRALRLAKAQPGEKLYDCGSGDGRVVLEASRHFQVRSIGIEISPLLYLIAYARKLMRQEALATFLCTDLFRVDLRDADIVFLFGRSETLGNKLKKKLERELKPGTRVLSYVFPIDGWEPAQISKDNPEEDLSIFLYTMDNAWGGSWIRTGSQ